LDILEKLEFVEVSLNNLVVDVIQVLVVVLLVAAVVLAAAVVLEAGISSPQAFSAGKGSCSLFGLLKLFLSQFCGCVFPGEWPPAADDGCVAVTEEGVYCVPKAIEDNNRF
jgi:hypothetical protein